jgi:predicted RNA binding protein YcfA (HicA-like mRNA interferase family)
MLIESNGWVFVRQRGSHRQYKHPYFRSLITIPGHKLSDDLPKGMENSILKTAGLK